MQEKTVEIDNKKVVYFETEGAARQKMLLMHGYSFESTVWQKIGFDKFLASIGFTAYALDMPGFPRSRNKFNLDEEETLQLISTFIAKVIKAKPTILGASASGYLALRFAEEHEKEIKAVIAVGAVNISRIDLCNISIPIFGIWGENDTISSPANGKKAFEACKKQVKILADAGHACYLDKPKEFMQEIADFLKSS